MISGLKNWTFFSALPPCLHYNYKNVSVRDGTSLAKMIPSFSHLCKLCLQSKLGIPRNSFWRCESLEFHVRITVKIHTLILKKFLGIPLGLFHKGLYEFVSLVNAIVIINAIMLGNNYNKKWMMSRKLKNYILFYIFIIFVVVLDIPVILFRIGIYIYELMGGVHGALKIDWCLGKSSVLLQCCFVELTLAHSCKYQQTLWNNKKEHYIMSTWHPLWSCPFLCFSFSGKVASKVSNKLWKSGPL